MLRFGHKAEVTFNYMPDVKIGMFVDYEDYRFRIEHLTELGTHEQTRAECM